jgi:hypothetical protein
MSIFEELGISKDRAGFNAFNELPNPEKKFKNLLESFFGKDVSIADIGSDLDVEIDTRLQREEFERRFGFEWTGSGFFGQRIDISPSEFNDITSELSSQIEEKSEEAKNEVKKASEGDKGSIVKIGAVALVGGAILWSMS